ncbi:hypothetical protein H7170_02380 [Candidatus Gracilibacteria bacterium]|nr:hypothetical protein [Candidatus Gracilibacteria bacterium]
MGEFERIESENPRGIELFERFLMLHSEFYGHILTLTSEESGEVDGDFREEILEESQRLKEVVHHIKKERGFLEALTGRVIGRSNRMADYFARCVADIFEGYDIDPQTNEIFFIYD